MKTRQSNIFTSSCDRKSLDAEENRVKRTRSDNIVLRN